MARNTESAPNLRGQGRARKPLELQIPIVERKRAIGDPRVLFMWQVLSHRGRAQLKRSAPRRAASLMQITLMWGARLAEILNECLIWRAMNKSSVAKRRRARVPRGRGRPASEAAADVRAALLGAARALFLKHGFAKVSSRQIAAAAHTTPAMIHYYFEDKHGLFRAIVADAIDPFTRQLTGALAQAPAQTIDPATLIAVHMRTGAANPWLGSLLANEVLAEGGELRTDFIRDVAQRLAPMLIRVLDSARARGELRADLDPKLTTLSFVSLCVFPLISRAVTGPVLGVRLEGADLERLVAHTAKLFLHGCAA